MGGNRLKPQLEVSFERNATGDSIAGVCVRHLHGYVVPSALYGLQDYFAALAPSDGSKAVEAAPKAADDASDAGADKAVLAKAAVVCSDVVAQAADTSVDDIGGFAPLIDISSARHEVLETRLFRS